MTVSMPLPWLLLVVVVLVLATVFATLRWSGRITRGQHAFHSDELSVHALARQLGAAARPDEPRERPRRPAA